MAFLLYSLRIAIRIAPAFYVIHLQMVRFSDTLCDSGEDQDMIQVYKIND